MLGNKTKKVVRAVKSVNELIEEDNEETNCTVA